MWSSAQNSSGVHWCRRRVRFNEVPEKVPKLPEKLWEALVFATRLAHDVRNERRAVAWWVVNGENREPNRPPITPAHPTRSLRSPTSVPLSLRFVPFGHWVIPPKLIFFSAGHRCFRGKDHWGSAGFDFDHCGGGQLPVMDSFGTKVSWVKHQKMRMCTSCWRTSRIPSLFLWSANGSQWRFSLVDNSVILSRIEDSRALEDAKIQWRLGGIIIQIPSGKHTNNYWKWP